MSRFQRGVEGGWGWIGGLGVSCALDQRPTLWATVCSGDIEPSLLLSLSQSLLLQQLSRNSIRPIQLIPLCYWPSTKNTSVMMRMNIAFMHWLCIVGLFTDRSPDARILPDGWTYPRLAELLPYPIFPRMAELRKLAELLPSTWCWARQRCFKYVMPTSILDNTHNI